MREIMNNYMYALSDTVHTNMLYVEAVRSRRFVVEFRSDIMKRHYLCGRISPANLPT